MSFYILFIACLTTLLFSSCQNSNTFFSSDSQPDTIYSPYLTYISTNNQNNPDYIDKHAIENILIDLLPNNQNVKNILSEYAPNISHTKHFFIQQQPNSINYCLYSSLNKSIPSESLSSSEELIVSQIDSYLQICNSNQTFPIHSIPKKSFLTIHHLNTTQLSIENKFLELSLKELLSQTPLYIQNTNNQITINSPAENSQILAQHSTQTFHRLDHYDFLKTLSFSSYFEENYNKSYLDSQSINIQQATSTTANTNSIQISYPNNTIAHDTYNSLVTNLKLQPKYSFQIHSFPDSTTGTFYQETQDQKIELNSSGNNISYTNEDNKITSITLNNNHILISHDSQTDSSDLKTNILSFDDLQNIFPNIFPELDFIKSIQYQILDNQLTGYIVK